QVADLLAGNVTEEAVVQPLSSGAGVRFCVRDDVGFVKPSSWAVQSQNENEVVFRVQIGGHVGYVRHGEHEWRMLDELEQVPVATGARLLQFEQVTVAGAQMSRAHFSDGPLIVCSGRLIWQGGETVVVEREDTVVACVSEDPAGAG